MTMDAMLATLVNQLRDKYLEILEIHKDMTWLNDRAIKYLELHEEAQYLEKQIFTLKNIFNEIERERGEG